MVPEDMLAVTPEGCIHYIVTLRYTLYPRYTHSARTGRNYRISNYRLLRHRSGLDVILDSGPKKSSRVKISVDNLGTAMTTPDRVSGPYLKTAARPPRLNLDFFLAPARQRSPLWPRDCFEADCRQSPASNPSTPPSNTVKTSSRTYEYQPREIIRHTRGRRRRPRSALSILRQPQHDGEGSQPGFSCRYLSDVAGREVRH